MTSVPFINVANDITSVGRQPHFCASGGCLQSDGLEIEAVFQSLCPSFDAPVLTSHSGWKRGEQAQVVIVLGDLFFLPVTSGVVGVLEGR